MAMEMVLPEHQEGDSCNINILRLGADNIQTPSGHLFRLKHHQTLKSEL